MNEAEQPRFSIAEQLRFTTVRIETGKPNGTKTGVGTGFIYAVKVDNKRQALFLVTNRHVVENAESGWLTFTVADQNGPILGNRYVLHVDGFGQSFTANDDANIDLAAIPFVPLVEHAKKDGHQIFFRSIQDELIPSQDQVEELDALEDVVFIGYPNGIWDAANNLPVVRRGITATPIAVDFQGHRTFLVDAAVFPGSSGSPVFLYNVGSFARKDGGTVIGSRVMFLGVIAAVFFREETGEIRMAAIPTAEVPVAVTRQMLNLGIVFKSDAVHELAQKIMVG